MANVIKLKRSAVTAAPTALAVGEPAYSEQSGNLFIGTGSGVAIIGGKTDHDKLATIQEGAQVNPLFADQTQAEAGLDNTTIMTPLRVAQAISLYSAGIPNDFNHNGPPTVDDDTTLGYAPGSVIIDTTAVPPEAYRCADATDGAAVWLKTTLTADELASVALTGSAEDLTEGATKKLLTVAERTKLGYLGVTQAVDLDQMELDILANNAKISNVTTDLSVTRDASNVTVVSSDGTDAIIPTADGTNAGALSAALYNNIIANNAKVSNVQTDLSVVTSGTQVTVQSSDGADAVLDSATSTNAGILTAALYNNIIANNAKVSNTITDLSVGTVTATEVPILSSDGADIATLPAAGAGLAGIIIAGAQRIAGDKTMDNLIGSSAAATIDSYIMDGGSF